MLETALKLAFIIVVFPWTLWILVKGSRPLPDEDAWEWYCRNIH
jgi:hypothetical protein